MKIDYKRKESKFDSINIYAYLLLYLIYFIKRTINCADKTTDIKEIG